MYYCYWDKYYKQVELALTHVKKTVKDCPDITEKILVLINLNMEVVLVNGKACELAGHEGKEIIGKNITDIFVPENLQTNMKDFIKKTIDNEIDNAERFHDIILNKKGEKKIIEWNALLLKDRTGEINGILGLGKDVTTERIEIQDMLIQAKNEWEETFDTINDAITIHDNNYNIIRANKTAIELFKISFDEIKKLKCFQLYHGCDSPLRECPYCDALIRGKTVVHKMFEPHLNKHLEIKAIPRISKNGQPFGMVHIARDISDQIKAEEKQRMLQDQLLYMQKMDSIGRLAGGVAHDFNNLLSGILGFSELALLEIPKDHPSRERIELVLGLGEKAASLTNQLLAFSRKQLLVMNNINLNDVVTNTAKMLKRIIGEDIILELKTAKTVSNVMADQSQMEQVLVNLAVNSRDAMPDGGTLTIETDDILIKKDDIQQSEEINPGKYVKIAVSDTGCGMDNKALENIFEPFYTTKDFGKGTGLGLSTVYGIIKQHNGFIDVSSEINKGTVFKIYLPIADMEEKKETDKSEAQISGGKETILVVDDEAVVISIIERALNPLGYQLLVALTPEDAIKINETYEGVIDLLLTDVIMPKMKGKDLAEKIISKRPGIKVLYMSGYLSEGTDSQSNYDEKQEFCLQKPIRINTLRQKLREALDEVNYS